MLLWDEGPLQAHWMDGRRSAPVAGSARGRDLGVTAANKRPAAGCSKETILQRPRSIGIRWSLSVVPQSLRCVGDREAGHHCPLAPRRVQIVLALEVATSWRPADGAAGNTPADPRDEHRESAVGSAADPWGTAQARHRYRTDERGQIYGQAKRLSISRVEDVPS